MDEEEITNRCKQLLKNLPYGGIRAVAELSGFPRSTVVDVLSNRRSNRRIDVKIIYKATAEYLHSRGINYEPLQQLI